jgi:hypothetical protein
MAEEGVVESKAHAVQVFYSADLSPLMSLIGRKILHDIGWALRETLSLDSEPIPACVQLDPEVSLPQLVVDILLLFSHLDRETVQAAVHALVWQHIQDNPAFIDLRRILEEKDFQVKAFTVQQISAI